MHTHGTDPSPLGESFYETTYFKQVIKPDGAFLYSRLRRIGAREAVPPDVLSIIGEGCACACTTVLALSRETGLTQKAVRNRLRLLEDEGWFRKIDRSGLPSAFVLGDASGLFADRVIRGRVGVTPTKKGRVGEGNPYQKGQGQTGTPTKKGRPLRGRKKGVKKTRPVEPLEEADYGLCSEDPFQKGQTPSDSIYIGIEAIDDTAINNTVRSTPTKKGRPPKPGRGWKTTPIHHWGSKTLWDMIVELLACEGIAASRIYLNQSDYSRFKHLRTRVDIEEARRVAEFFCVNYRALRAAFDWHGGATPGLFVGFFDAIQRHADGKPIKGKRNCERGSESQSKVANWRPFTGETPNAKA